MPTDTWSLDDFLRDAGFAWELEERIAIHEAVAKWIDTYDGIDPCVNELADILREFGAGY